MNAEVVLETNLQGLGEQRRGKVRDIYELGERLFIVATDRISAFDVVLPDGIPMKGKVLTLLSEFWFNFTADLAPNHLITTRVEEMGEEALAHQEVLDSRTMMTKKAEVVPVECVVRGYLAGSGWREYEEKGAVCGCELPEGLEEAARLPEPIFTPATKAEKGHDVNISFDEAAAMAGRDVMEEIRKRTLAVYERAREYASRRGIIVCDTKMEWGFVDGELTLVDELLTPDSSRFWPADGYKPGGAQPSFDKQFVRDYLESLNWDKTPSAPHLPDEVIRKTSDKYLEAYRRLVGKELLGSRPG